MATKEDMESIFKEHFLASDFEDRYKGEVIECEWCASDRPRIMTTKIMEDERICFSCLEDLIKHFQKERDNLKEKAVVSLGEYFL